MSDFNNQQNNNDANGSADYSQQPQQPQQPYYNAPNQPVNGQPGYQQPQAPQAPQRQYFDVPPAGYQQKSRLAAGLLGIMFGCFGVHNFYMGYTTKAIIQLVVSIAGTLIFCGVPLGLAAMEIWGLVEGIQILSASNPTRRYDGKGVIMKD